MSIWGCEKQILKKYVLRRSVCLILMLYLMFMSDFEGILAPLNKHPTGDLLYLSRHKPISVAIHDTLNKEPMYLVEGNVECLIEKFI